MMKTFIAVIMVFAGVASPTSAGAEDVKLLSFNMWGAGANAGKPIDETVAVIKASGADIVGAQETVPEPADCSAESCAAQGPSRAPDIAKALGYHYHEFKWNTDNHWADAVFSKYPIVRETPNGTGVVLDVNGKKVVAYSMNLDDAPYQPYQLLNIAYGNFPFLKMADEAVKSAAETRGKALALLLADIEAEGDAAAQFVMGDFNEPSHQDWSDAAVKAGRQPMAVAWPTAKAVEDAGFVDTFRAAFPDVAAKPGITWTPTIEPDDPEDHHDRIDFILARAAALTVKTAGIAGEKAPEADLVVTPWPSDHRATMAEVSF